MQPSGRLPKRTAREGLKPASALRDMLPKLVPSAAIQELDPDEAGHGTGSGAEASDAADLPA
jgi:hypothetical protein